MRISFVLMFLLRIAVFSQQTSYEVKFDWIESKNIKMAVSNIGLDSYNFEKNEPGFLAKLNDGKFHPVIYNDAVLLGGIVDGEVRISGNLWNSISTLIPGYFAGRDSILFKQPGIWKIVDNIDSLNNDSLKNVFLSNWTNWPVDIGAPWSDNDNDNVYSPSFDSPKLFADENIYTVFNDYNPEQVEKYFRKPQLNLELHLSVFAFKDQNFLGDVIFKRYKIINKNRSPIEKFYFSFFVDPDIGFSNDDYVGCDSSLGLSYAYNSKNNDDILGTNVPAVGQLILGNKKNGTENYPGMTSFTPLSDWNNIVRVFPVSDDSSASYAYNEIKGFKQDGSSVINPVTKAPTLFPLNGDPVSKKGWYLGRNDPSAEADDYFYLLSSGPVDLAPDESITIDIANFYSTGSSNLNSVTLLKEKAKLIKQFYSDSLVKEEYFTGYLLPGDFILYQNYPNPFNLSTIIKYSIPGSATGSGSARFVTLRVYDILGREITTLVDELQLPGTYKVIFNANELTSGIYFYTLSTGNYNFTKKMILLK